ncbi:TetR/AcrR family transcriptional regulator [Lichenicola sp.]|uniref:TetR/AcrR family transcriptional regulator n=1 Tax=Lichenicola sp. TaxID=2804529 RepID=UPI003B00667E
MSSVPPSGPVPAPASQPPAEDRGRPYHHGDLAAALLEAAGAILEEAGIVGLTLRAVARRAGVSHMAPAHHFGDLTGLLSELAAVGFRRFSAELGTAGIETGGRGLDGMGRAYVGFARSHPALFQLMFRSERLDAERPALKQAFAEAGTMLTRAAAGFEPGAGPPTLEQVAASVRAWSLVHGYAMLLIDGRLEGALALPAPTEGTVDSDTLLRAVLASR